MATQSEVQEPAAIAPTRDLFKMQSRLPAAAAAGPMFITTLSIRAKKDEKNLKLHPQINGQTNVVDKGILFDL